MDQHHLVGQVLDHVHIGKELLIPDQRQALLHQIAHLYDVFLRTGLPAVSQKILDDVLAPVNIIDDQLKALMVRIIARKPLQDHVGIEKDAGQRIVQFMRNACGKLADGGHLLRLGQLTSRFDQSLFHFKAISQILVDPHGGDFFTVLIDNGSGQLHGNLQAVFVDDGGADACNFSLVAVPFGPQLLHDLLCDTGRIKLVGRNMMNGIFGDITEQLFGHGIHQQDLSVTVCGHNGHCRALDQFFKEKLGLSQDLFKRFQPGNVAHALHDVGDFTVFIQDG